MLPCLMSLLSVAWDPWRKVQKVHPLHLHPL